MKNVNFSTYLIAYNITDFYEVRAVSYLDAITEFARYVGEDVPLVVKALRAMDTVEERIALFNKLSFQTIDTIYLISEKKSLKKEG